MEIQEGEPAPQRTPFDQVREDIAARYQLLYPGIDARAIVDEMAEMLKDSGVLKPEAFMVEQQDDSLEVELATFEARLPEFLATHPDEWVLIKKDEVNGFFPTQDEGIASGYELHGNTPFLVRQILEEQPVAVLSGPR